jgi:D-aminopeptidase
MGFKGGIGTASRVLPESMGGYSIGVLVQTNFGGVLSINGAPVGRELGTFSYSKRRTDEAGSCMIVVATDAPARPHDLKRIAKRAIFSMARVGAAFSNGSGDYAICFSTAREKRNERSKLFEGVRVGGRDLSPIFFAVQEATEEAIINSMLAAETVVGFESHRVEALPREEVVEICRRYKTLGWSERLPGAESME